MTLLGLISALDDSAPNEDFNTWMSPEQIEYHCFNRILSALSDHLYDVYHSATKIAKELWETLEAKYGIPDVSMFRFTISTFNNYKMVDNKPVIHEFQELLRKVEMKGTKLSEEFKVSCLIDKLPPSWINYAKSLRHK